MTNFAYSVARLVSDFQSQRQSVCWCHVNASEALNSNYLFKISINQWSAFDNSLVNKNPLFMLMNIFGEKTHKKPEYISIVPCFIYGRSVFFLNIIYAFYINARIKKRRWFYRNILTRLIYKFYTVVERIVKADVSDCSPTAVFTPTKDYSPKCQSSQFYSIRCKTYSLSILFT